MLFSNQVLEKVVVLKKEVWKMAEEFKPSKSVKYVAYWTQKKASKYYEWFDE